MLIILWFHMSYPSPINDWSYFVGQGDMPISLLFFFIKLLFIYYSKRLVILYLRSKLSFCFSLRVSWDVLTFSFSSRLTCFEDIYSVWHNYEICVKFALFEEKSLKICCFYMPNECIRFLDDFMFGVYSGVL